MWYEFFSHIHVFYEVSVKIRNCVMMLQIASFSSKTPAIL